MNIVLIGFKSSGKSTVARALALHTGRAFTDVDTLIEALYEKLRNEPLSCRAIYARHGESFMRDMEHDALQSLVNIKNTVIATGGGAVLRPENIPLLRSLGTCVFIDTPLAVLEQRLAPHSESPLFKTHGVAELLEARRPLYLAAAHQRLDAPPQASAEDLALAIAALVT